MKKILFYSAVITLLIQVSCIYEGWEKGVTGNGNVVQEERDLKGFSGVTVSTGIDVELSQGNDFHVVVEADDNLTELIETEVRGDMLIIKTDSPGIRRAAEKKVYVTLPSLDRIRISSAGDCETKTPFICEDLELKVSSAGDLQMEVNAERIDVEISSSGDARLRGKVDELDASLSSAGDLNAFDLVARKVDVRVSSAGDARVHAEEEISMDASSAGNIYYKGNARIVHSRSSSAGDIIRKD